MERLPRVTHDQMVQIVEIVPGRVPVSAYQVQTVSVASQTHAVLEYCYAVE